MRNARKPWTALVLSAFIAWAASATTADADIVDAVKAVGQGVETALKGVVNGVVNGVKQSGKGVKKALVPTRSPQDRAQKQQHATQKSMAHAAKSQQRQVKQSVNQQDGQKILDRQVRESDNRAQKILSSYEREGRKQQRQADRQARANNKDFGTPMQRYETKSDSRRDDRQTRQADLRSRRDDIKKNWNQNEFVEKRRGI